jgi:hypothetical protein
VCRIRIGTERLSIYVPPVAATGKRNSEQINLADIDKFHANAAMERNM